ncbi:telomere length regulation protein-domain-containing protein [Phycomyces nitens]|nr:telomere length regulation protein-domain-containing protein [Phycomyces nitens]
MPPLNIQTVLDELDSLDAKAKQNPTQFETAVQCLDQPLKWLHSESDQISLLPIHLQLQLIRHAAWKRHLWTVCQTIIPNWAFTLGPLSPHRNLLESTFGHIHTNPTVHRLMGLTSLSILLESLSTEKDCSLNALEIYAQLIKGLVSPMRLRLYVANAADQSDGMDSQFLCTLLCSVPARLGNAFGLETLGGSNEWYLDRNYFIELARQLAWAVVETGKSSIGFLAELLAKMVRQGYTEICIRTIYPIALAHLQTSKSIPVPWNVLWQDAERMSTAHGLSKTTLFFVHETLKAQQTDKTQPIKGSVIRSMAVDLSLILFGAHKDIRRVTEFAKHVIFELAAVRWTDADTLRLGIAAAVIGDWESGERVGGAREIVGGLLTIVIEKWTDPVFIRHGSAKEREYITAALNILAGYLDKDSLGQIVSETGLMSGITRWFGSADIETAKLGVVVAESVSGHIDSNEARFVCGVLDLQTDKRLFALKDLIDTRDAFAEDSKENLKDLFKDQAQDQEADIDQEADTEQEAELDPDALFDPNESERSEESDLEPYLMETESDDEEKGVREKAKSVRPPAYILDLISYLEDHDDPVKLEIGLGAASTIIRQKAGIGSEIGENCIQVASLLIRLPETYELTDFRQRQQDALVALLVAEPKVASFIIDQIYDRNTSNGQKQVLLAAIALAVRELAGWTEDGVTNILDKAIEKDPGSLSGTLLTRPTGTVRVFSHSAEIQRKRQEAIKTNRLNGLAQPVFFTPLLLGWWEGAETRARWWIGHDKILSERFIMTLNIILHSSTNTMDKRRIVTEYFEFCSSLRYTNCTRGMKHSMLLGIDTILNTSYRNQPEILLSQFARELAGVQEWLQDLVKGVEEDDIKQLAINLLSQIMQISLTQ